MNNNDNKKLLNNLTEKIIERNLNNHMIELELLDINLNNLVRHINRLDKNEEDYTTIINTYTRLISLFESISSNFYSIKSLITKYNTIFRTKEFESLKPILNKFKKKCSELDKKIEDVEINEIDILFRRTADNEKHKYKKEEKNTQ